MALENDPSMLLALQLQEGEARKGLTNMVAVDASLPPEVLEQLHLQQAMAESEKAFGINNPDHINPDALSYEVYIYIYIYIYICIYIC